jgi:maltose alpha-D-glucosyltransferase/alpha-amylase
MQAYLSNEGDSWQLTVDHAQRYYEWILTHRRKTKVPPSLGLTNLAQTWEMKLNVMPDFVPLARLLGTRTGELHAALFGAFKSGDNAPRPYTSLTSRAFYQSVRNLSAKAFDALKVIALPDETQAHARELLSRWGEVRRSLDRALGEPLVGQTMRVHGDYHLGQVLFTGRDFHVIDFEGEPGRSPRERMRLRSPMADVAGMLRSLHYAAFGSLMQQLPGGHIREDDRERLMPWARFFYEACAREFYSSYLATVQPIGILPDREDQRTVLLDMHLIEKALYELVYELNNRPGWAELPLQGLLALLPDAAPPAPT